MKIKSAIIQSVVILILTSCSAKKQISTSDVSDGKIIVVGLIEYDYSQLKNKTIKGIDVFLDPKTEARNFTLSSKYYPKTENKYYSYISKIGNKGNYEMVYQHNTTSGEIDNLISMMELDKNSNSHKKIPIQNYSLNDCKIINLGKITVNYKGGDIVDGLINYSYTFSYTGDDTTAIHALKETQPSIISSYKNDICSFKSDFEQSIDYILGNISEGKRTVLKQFIEEHPDKMKIVFKDLNSDNKDKYTAEIEKFSFDELNEFLNGSK